MESVLRSSEFWVALVLLVGTIGGQAGWWSAQEFDTIVKPALVYITSRIISKLAKSVRPAPPATK